jgi:hypothetical protein
MYSIYVDIHVNRYMLLFMNVGKYSIYKYTHCGENSRIFRDAADQTLPVTEISGICNLKIKFSYISRNIQLQVTFSPQCIHL